MNLPLHTISQITEAGTAIRRIDFRQLDSLDLLSYVDYSHRDDYYMFGIIRSGECTLNIDFNDYRFTPRHMMCLCPGQVHSFIGSVQLCGIGIIVDSSLVDDNTRHIIDRYTLDYRPAEISPMQRNELESIFELIELRQHACDGHSSAGIIHHLARAAVDIVAEVFVENDPACNAPSSRNRIIAAFNDLLSKHISSHRRPSYYSDRLNISTVYLNQIVKEATGMNTGNYIRARIMLEAKRMLAHSTLPVNGIATALGFDDHAYFTRAFTLCVGISPAAFRRKYID